jgi:hypothetical protein
MSRHKPVQIESDELCKYGCNSIAKYKFKSGAVCCSDAIQKCEGHKKRSLATRRADIDENGLNAMQRGQASSCLNKKQTGAFERAGKSISATKNLVLENGMRHCDISNKKMQVTKLIVGDDGLTNAQRSARKAADTRLNDIDENGLNQYERWTIRRINNGDFEKGFEKSKQMSYHSTGIRCQGSYELKFLDTLVSKYSKEWVKDNVMRGPSIQYIDTTEKQRWYLSDFLIGNVVYEIKSNWTWNRRGKDLILEQNNINKLKATLAVGYDVKLIREGVEIDFA